jgi:hypothetical protein
VSIARWNYEGTSEFHPADFQLHTIGEGIVSECLSFFQKDDGFFDPEAANALVAAVEAICKTLGVTGDAHAREVIAARVIDLARTGERDPVRLRDRVLHEANVQAAPSGLPDSVRRWRGL